MSRIRIRHLVAAFLAASLSASLARASGLPLEGPEAEAFLRQARVVNKEKIPVGVTDPTKLTLETDELTAHAVWKTVDEFESKKRFDDGRWEAGFVDSHENEIAAYELDKLLALGLVPPTVERTLGRETGSLQLWVEEAMMETERMDREIAPQDVESWNRQMLKIRLFRNLTHDVDFNNSGNVLSDPDGRLYLIDNSRSFRTQKDLVHEAGLTRFSRSLLESLRRLDETSLRAKLGRWLTKRQIKGLLARRDLIVARAERLVAEQGEDAVLSP